MYILQIITSLPCEFGRDMKHLVIDIFSEKGIRTFLTIMIVNQFVIYYIHKHISYFFRNLILIQKGVLDIFYTILLNIEVCCEILILSSSLTVVYNQFRCGYIRRRAFDGIFVSS